MIVPVGKSRFDPGRNVMNANAPKKNASGLRRENETTRIATAATAIHASQSGALPLASGICAYE
jgi:hypothetical protein